MRLRGSRRTNLALAVVVPAALLTGALAFATGASWVGWIVGAHAAMGLALVIVSPWKTAIALHGLRRRPGPRSWPSIALGVSIVVTVATGLLHSTGLVRTLGPLTAMQAHVATALASIPLFVWHLAARPIAPRRTDLSRRALLRAAVLGGASVASYGAVVVITDALSLPGADRRGTGSYEVASLDPGGMPVTQWLDDAVPAPDASPSLDVLTPDGARCWSLGELATFDDSVRAVLDCTGGWYSTQEWRGVLLSRLLPRNDETRSVLVRSVTGYTRRFPASDADHLLLALRLGGAPLSIGHGAPIRIVAPGRRGFWWVKWVTSVEAASTPWWWQPPFPIS
jgi:Oxidoreductase molybdopterin binding domain